MHILVHNPTVCAIVHIGLQGESFQGGQLPDPEATTWSNIILKHLTSSSVLCAQKNSTRLVVLKVQMNLEMHEGAESVKESKVDVLQGRLYKFRMKDGEGIAEMYSRLEIITN